MQTTILALALGAGLLAALPAAQPTLQTVPTANGCLRTSQGPGSVTVTNVCNYTVQAKLRFSEGNDYDTDFTPGYSYTRRGARVKTFACRDGVASGSNEEFVEPSFDTTEYWCVKASNE